MLAFQASGFANDSAFVKTTTRHVDKTSRRAGRVERLCNFEFWTRPRPLGYAAASLGDEGIGPINIAVS